MELDVEPTEEHQLQDHGEVKAEDQEAVVPEVGGPWLSEEPHGEYAEEVIEGKGLLPSTELLIQKM